MRRNETGRPRRALERLRRLMLVPALISAALALATIVTSASVDAPLRIAGAAAALLLALHWTVGYRRGRFPALGDIPEALAVLLVLLAAPGQPPLPLFGTTFRALYRGALPRVAVWSAAVAGTSVLHGTFDLQDQLGKSGGLLIGAALMILLGRTFSRLERSESKLRAVLEQSTDVVTILGEDHRIRWQAESVRTVLGHDPARMETTPFVDHVHPDDAATVSEVLARGSATPVAFRMRDAAGGYRDIEASVADRLHDEDIQGVLVTLRDVTERRSLERLAERVEAQRQRQELEARLQRSARMESVGQLAGGVAHDFNNLLSAILNYTAIIRLDLLEEHTLQEDLGEIEHAARRGARLVQQLLVFSQGKLTSPELVDPNAVIGELDGLLRHSLGKHVRLEYELDPELETIHADVTNIEQVVVNLVVNARDAVEVGGGIVTLTTDKVDLHADAAVDLDVAPGEYVRISVSDDGCGMDERTLARACEPFFTTKGPGEGTGLGLATVHGIATHSGGYVTIESAPAKGTTVNVHLPSARIA